MFEVKVVHRKTAGFLFVRRVYKMTQNDTCKHKIVLYRYMCTVKRKTYARTYI